MRLLRGSWCGLVASALTPVGIFPAVREISAAVVPPGGLPPARDDEVDGATAAMAELDLAGVDNVEEIVERSDDQMFRPGRLGSGHANMVDHGHSRLGELERTVGGILHSGRGDARWLGGELEARPHHGPMSLTELPPEVLERVATFRVDAGATSLTDRLDVLGMLSSISSRFADQAWDVIRRLSTLCSTRRQERNTRFEYESLGEIFGLEPDEAPQPFFANLFNTTQNLFRGITYGRPTRAGPQAVLLPGPGRLMPPQLKASLRLRPGAAVCIKPWGGFADWTQIEMEEWLKSLCAAGDCARGPPGTEQFPRWSRYLEEYADSEATGEVVEFLPVGTIAGLPEGHLDQEGGYLVRFPLPAETWEWDHTWGPSPFVEMQVHGPIAYDLRHNQDGWRLTPASATRLPQGQDELLLEVPESMLYPYVELRGRHPDPEEADPDQANPFETVLQAIR